MEGSSLNPVDVAVVTGASDFGPDGVCPRLRARGAVGGGLDRGGAGHLMAVPGRQPPIPVFIFPPNIVADGVTILGSFYTGLDCAVGGDQHHFPARSQESSLSAIDRSLGFAFGVVRGAVLVSLAYLFAVWLWPEQPVWLRNAKAKPFLETGADIPARLSAQRRPVPPRSARRSGRSTGWKRRRMPDALWNGWPIRAPHLRGTRLCRNRIAGYNADDLGRLDQVIKSTDQPPPGQPDRRPDGDQR